MTTAQQLMSDKEFCARRVQEQDDYMYDLHVRLHNQVITYDRYIELAEAAMHQRFKFSLQLETDLKLSEQLINGHQYWSKPCPDFIKFIGGVDPIDKNEILPSKSAKYLSPINK